MIIEFCQFLSELNSPYLIRQNFDQCSFGHAIAFFYHPSDWSDHPFKPATEKRFIQHGLNKIKFPVLLEEIPSLEEQLNLRINVFSFTDPEGLKRCYLHISKKYKPDEINLLYWEGRFAWIKHFSRLFSDARKCTI